MSCGSGLGRGRTNLPRPGRSDFVALDSDPRILGLRALLVPNRSASRSEIGLLSKISFKSLDQVAQLASVHCDFLS